MRIKDTRSNNGSPVTVSSRFSDFDHFTEVIRAWDLDFRQIERGKLNASLEQVNAESWSLARARFDQSAYQQGLSVPGMRSFAILEADAPSVDWCGHSLSQDTVAAFAADREFRSISPPGFDVYTISFSEEELSSTCEVLGLPSIVEKLDRRDALYRVSPAQAAALRHVVDVSVRKLCKDSSGEATERTVRRIQQELCERLIALLLEAHRVTPTDARFAKSQALTRALDFIEENLGEPATVREIAAAAGTCRRSLEYGFRNRFNASPMAFMNTQRLIRVKRQLRNPENDRKIVDIANAVGLWHMGQFAKDYRRQFGELPSETGKRSKLARVFLGRSPKSR